MILHIATNDGKPEHQLEFFNSILRSCTRHSNPLIQTLECHRCVAADLQSLGFSSVSIVFRQRNALLTMDDQDLYSGLIRLHVLHHACEGEIFGLEMIEELGRHGYKMSPGSMYPILHGLEKRGYLKSVAFRSGRVRRRVYKATPSGRKALKAAKQKVCELFGELIEGK